MVCTGRANGSLEEKPVTITGAGTSGDKPSIHLIEKKTTFCRICEAFCGLVATVEDGKLVNLEPDPDNPYSRGFACVKGVAGHHFQNDPERVTTPLRRVGGPGEFEPVTWDEALDDIAARLVALRERHGPKSVALEMG